MTYWRYLELSLHIRRLALVIRNNTGIGEPVLLRRQSANPLVYQSARGESMFPYGETCNCDVCRGVACPDDGTGEDMNYPDDYPLVLRSHELATIEDAATYLAASGEAKLVEKLQKILDRADVG